MRRLRWIRTSPRTLVLPIVSVVPDSLSSPYRRKSSLKTKRLAIQRRSSSSLSEIINHKGRLEAAEYFIVNPLDVIDCVDREASETKADILNKKMIRSCKRLVLREDVIPTELKIFRLGFWSGRIIIRRELADSMQAAGLTLMKFFEPEKYKGF